MVEDRSTVNADATPLVYNYITTFAVHIKTFVTFAITLCLSQIIITRKVNIQGPMET